MTCLPLIITLFPYTTLFRSGFYRSIFSDLRFDIADQVTQGNRVATRWTLHGTYRRRPVTLHGIVISRFRDGKIIEDRSEEHTSELQSLTNLVCRLLLEKKNI